MLRGICWDTRVRRPTVAWLRVDPDSRQDRSCMVFAGEVRFQCMVANFCFVIPVASTSIQYSHPAPLRGGQWCRNERAGGVVLKQKKLFARQDGVRWCIIALQCPFFLKMKAESWKYLQKRCARGAQLERKPIIAGSPL